MTKDMKAIFEAYENVQQTSTSPVIYGWYSQAGGGVGNADDIVEQFGASFEDLIASGSFEPLKHGYGVEVTGSDDISICRGPEYAVYAFIGRLAVGSDTDQLK